MDLLLWGLVLLGAAAVGTGFVIVNVSTTADDLNLGYGAEFVGILILAICLVLASVVGGLT
ncbi:hypothetical protein [Bradyrhizobium erythrophlei]|uniref:Uncharacterized protein n=1 Tax=Bradyrhizobium erythrophlei TaxID=1437360 RepID=A0A1H4NYP5_9BRAD|nr:hypothetical protein [Bradyrhizobium erythrophlei]SEC00320.1 hypothetical protein SAMN05444164_0771 [Bradyrhizobium erythrophlei]